VVAINEECRAAQPTALAQRRGPISSLGASVCYVSPASGVHFKGACSSPRVADGETDGKFGGGPHARPRLGFVIRRNTVQEQDGAHVQIHEQFV
jgi:hypothetical protein